MSAMIGQARDRFLQRTFPLPRPRLTVVPRLVRRAPRVPFVVLVVLVLASGLVGLLLLNTHLERGAFTVTSLTQRADALSAQQQQLEIRVGRLQQPQHVAAAAIRLGMVRSVNPAYLSLRSGRVSGLPAKATTASRMALGTVRVSSVGPSTKWLPTFAGQANQGVTRPVTRAAVGPAGRATAGRPGSGQATSTADTRPTSAGTTASRDRKSTGTNTR